MVRFFGMMTAYEVEKEMTWSDGGDMFVTLQAGPKGWTIIFADSSTQYADVIATTEENYQSAVAVLKGHFPSAYEVAKGQSELCDEDCGEERDDFGDDLRKIVDLKIFEVRFQYYGAQCYRAHQFVLATSEEEAKKLAIASEFTIRGNSGDLTEVIEHPMDEPGVFFSFDTSR